MYLHWTKPKLKAKSLSVKGRYQKLHFRFAFVVVNVHSPPSKGDKQEGKRIASRTVSGLISVNALQGSTNTLATLNWPLLFPSPIFFLINLVYIVICRKCPHCCETRSDSDYASDLNGLPSHFCVRYQTLIIGFYLVFLISLRAVWTLFAYYRIGKKIGLGNN